MASKTLSLYGGKHTLVFSEGNHRYKVDGEYKPGVTTMIGILAKDGLIQWASNKACDWVRLNCPPQDPTGESWLVTEQDLRQAKNAHATLRDDAAGIGTKVHKWIEQYIAGDYGDMTPDMEPAVTAFLAWQLVADPTYLHSERAVYSEAHDYCGTTDVVCLLNGKRTILDFKTGHPEREWNQRRHCYTGRTRAYSTAFIQDALYDIAIEEEDGEAAEQYAVLYLPVEGTSHLFVTDKVSEFRQAGLDIVALNNSYGNVKHLNEWSENA